MSDVNLVDSGFFVLRAPLLSIDELRAWSSDLTAFANRHDPAALESAVEADQLLLRERLRALVARPEIREAIFVASPSVSERLPVWLAQPKSKEGAKVESVLVRYFARMSGRATPFGLFAGFCVGRMGATTQLEVTAGGTRHVRLDMEYLYKLAEDLQSDLAVRDRLTFRPNSSLYEIGGRVHYPAIRVTGDTRAYELTAIELDEPLRHVLSTATGGVTRQAAAECLVGDDVSREEALAFVDQLIDAHVLESNLVPPITGGDPLATTIGTLRSSGALTDEGPSSLGALERTRDALERLAVEPLGAPPARYLEIAELLAPLPTKINMSHLFQVDMSKTCAPLLGRAELLAIARGVELLHRITPNADPVEAFARAFRRRYDQREVPLMEVLDEENGIGFADPTARPEDPAPLIVGLGLREKAKEELLPWSTRERLLLSKLEDAWRSEKQTIQITEDDVIKMTVDDRHPLPTSLAAFASVLASDDAPSRRRIWLNSYVSPARFLGRFSPWNAELKDLLRGHLEHEESLDPNAIFAEIVHLPSGSRIANVLLRPLLRQHEITYAGRSGAALDKTITVSDLMVSVRDKRVVLRSKRLGRRIIPRLASAHQYGVRQLGAYSFLGSLQVHGVSASGSWSWGPLGEATFLPRVEHNGLILSPRKWRLDQVRTAGLSQASAAARFRAVDQVRAEFGLPRHVGLEEGDNVLPVDLDNTLSVDSFVSALKQRTSARLVELFHDAVPAGAVDGAYVKELLVPFLSSGSVVTARAEAVTRTDEIVRRFVPGTEWLSTKIFCARGSIDHVLRVAIAPVVARRRASHAEPWFFVRSVGGEAHLRLRFHGSREDLSSSVLTALERALDPLVSSERVRRWEVGTYEREVERYGGAAGIEACERIFCADSRAALALVSALGAGGEAQARWGLALYGMDRLLSDFGLDVAQRLALIQAASRENREELRVTTDSEHKIDARFRLHRPFVEALLDGGQLDAPTLDTFRARSEAIAPLARRLREVPITVTIESIITNLIHMWNNRVLRTKALQHEVVLHAFLAKHYESKLARRR